MPTLILWGTDDIFFPMDDARHLAALIPGAELVEIPGAELFHPLERPDLLAGHLRRLWQAPPATASGPAPRRLPAGRDPGRLTHGQWGISWQGWRSPSLSAWEFTTATSVPKARYSAKWRRVMSSGGRTAS